MRRHDDSIMLVGFPEVESTWTVPVAGSEGDSQWLLCPDHYYSPRDGGEVVRYIARRIAKGPAPAL